MKKKIFSMLVALSMVCCTLASCGSDDSSSTAETTAGTNESVADTATDALYGTDKYPVSDTTLTYEDLPTANMLGRSVLNEGDTSRLASKIAYGKNISDDEVMTIAFIGGSITQGSSATGNNQYVPAVGEWWKDNVTRRTKVLNAGIGATDSYIGVHRVDRDVLAENPDVIFIEFSVNDTNAAVNRFSYESLIRKCLAQENNPAVVLIVTTQEDGTSLQDVHAEVGEYYNLPIISYHDAIYPEVQAGTLDWDLISQDNIHPDDNGHPILTALITNYLKNIVDNVDTLSQDVAAFDTAPMSGDDMYANATMGNRESTDIIKTTDEGTFTESPSFQKFTDGWGTTTGGSVTFEIEARNIGAIYYKSIKGDMGKAEISVDGEVVATLDGNFADGWGNYAESQQLYTSDTSAKHTVTVTVEDGDAQSFQILNWLVS